MKMVGEGGGYWKGNGKDRKKLRLKQDHHELRHPGMVERRRARVSYTGVAAQKTGSKWGREIDGRAHLLKGGRGGKIGINKKNAAESRPFSSSKHFRG